MKFSYKAAGDSAILIKIKGEVNEKTNNRLLQITKRIEEDRSKGFDEVIIGYDTVLVHYNPLKMSYIEAIEELSKFEKLTGRHEVEQRSMIEIPVLYGGKHGPDLERVARHSNLSTEEVISIHSQPRYLVHFLGFTPGYPFMGGMSEKIATPRLESPRISIPPGSVGIAKNQTGIYPVESPGGWNLIGNTPLCLYNSKAEYPFLLKAGDVVLFKPIQLEEYKYIQNQVKQGIYDF